MTVSGEGLDSRLRETALIVLRRHHVGEDELKFEENEPHEATSCLITGHRVRVYVDGESASFRARSGKWSGRRPDFPTAGAFLAAFEEALNDALSGG